MLKEGFNKVQIEGVLNSITCREDDTTIQTKDGERKCKYIALTLEIKTSDDNLVPVEAYSKSLRKDGEANKIYKSLQTIKGYNSMGEVGDKADNLSVSTGQLTENLFVTDDLTVVKQAKIRSNFFNRALGQVSPKANFNIEGFVLKTEDGMDSDGVDNGTLKVFLGVVKYAGRIDVLEFDIETEKGVSFFKQYVKTGDTLKVGGNLIFSKKVIKETVDESDVGFGEPIVSERTISNRKLVITTASKPYDKELAYDKDEIQAAILQREEFIEEQKQTKKQPKTQKTETGFGFNSF